MTRSKLDNLYPYDHKIDITFHRLSSNNRSVILHDKIVLDNSIMHIDFITDFVSEPDFSAFES